MTTSGNNGACMRVRACIHVHAFMHVCVGGCAAVLHLNISIFVWRTHTGVRTHTRTHTLPYTHACTHTHTQTHTHRPMSAQPLERLLGVPDLVENVFLRLDPTNRQAFFQAHRGVAQNGHVLAQTKLRIELTPQSLQDQWQHVLRLTRCANFLQCVCLSWFCTQNHVLHQFAVWREREREREREGERERERERVSACPQLLKHAGGSFQVLVQPGGQVLVRWQSIDVESTLSSPFDVASFSSIQFSSWPCATAILNPSKQLQDHAANTS